MNTEMDKRGMIESLQKYKQDVIGALKRLHRCSLARTWDNLTQWPLQEYDSDQVKQNTRPGCSKGARRSSVTVPNMRLNNQHHHAES